MSKRDYYEVLGVQKNVSEDDLKKAFRRLAMKHHPDRNPDNAESEAKFKEAKEAYEVLNDPQKRAAYDQFGHAGVDQSSGFGGGGRGGAQGGFGDVFEDIFGDIFGGGRGGRGGGGANRAYRGSDLQYNLELTLEDAVFGTTTDIRVPSLQHCDTCNGSGAKAGTHRKPAQPAMAVVRCGFSKVSLLSSRLARIVTAKAKSLPTLALTATVKDAKKSRKPCQCVFQQVWTMAIGYA